MPLGQDKTVAVSEISNKTENLKQILNSRFRMSFVKLVPVAGLELATYRLQGGCSTN